MQTMADISLREHTAGQLRRLCRVAGLAESDQLPLELLGHLLGPAGESRLGEPACFPSRVSDDATPVEFSLAFDGNGQRAVRILGESVNTYPERKFLDDLASELRLYTDRFDAVQDIFLPAKKHGIFTLWYSLIFGRMAVPRLKVYLNPQVSGPLLAGMLVNEGLRRLGITRAYDAVVAHALTRGRLDQFSFFALDLDNSPESRVKLYISHDHAETADIERAAALVPGVDPMQIREFCAILGGGKGPFDRRPLVSSYSYIGGDNERPSTFSLYLPIRDYVPDDEVARARLLAILAQYNIDGEVLDDALAAVSSRPLRNGVGLIAHVSLRLGDFGSGLTVYLSSEAFGVAPPRNRSVLGLISSSVQ